MNESPAPSNSFAERVKRLENALDGGSGLTVLAIGLAPDLLACIREQQAALEGVMVGGNHLALLIGNHPPAGTDIEAVQKHYLPHHQDMYEAWRCWNAIMQARAALTKWRVSERR